MRKTIKGFIDEELEGECWDIADRQYEEYKEMKIEGLLGDEKSAQQ